MAKPAVVVVDYSLYLVTEPRPALEKIVEDALRGGATVVQLRDKDGTDEEVCATARRLLPLTRRFGVPLLINDRVRVAVEVGADGVHVGQGDMDVREARALMGGGKIVGVSASSVEEAVGACERGADYIGIGTVFATPTKKDTRTILGPEGVRKILSSLSEAGHVSTPTVCIGGVDASNAAPLLSLSRGANNKSLDGIAVVRALVAAEDPFAAASRLRALVLAAKVADVVASVARRVPLSHNMTNLVVQNFAANVVLAIGASPIMSASGPEAADLASGGGGRGGGALVINTGTITPDGLANQLEALKAYNSARKPVVLDPVGVGATSIRRNAVNSLLSTGHFTAIKANASEMLSLHLSSSSSSSSSSPLQRGVDSTTLLTPPSLAALTRAVSLSHRCIAITTGKSDFVSDGRRTIRVANGHDILASVTGSGCCLGAVVASALASYDADPLLACLGAVVVYAVAAEFAAARVEVRGPGTFVPAFLDELYAIRTATLAGDLRWLAMVRVESVDVDDEATPCASSSSSLPPDPPC
ncbi:hypothetical protein CP532_3436 [Ophiocordyceps camponoti-leonardi (nom. inval.)]|nr:hypothetical protein CP532_3436 [Ophiocordyceps camponoti-leonardi (nom. inval.)]